MTDPAATPARRILVLGASGLIGHFVAGDLCLRGHTVVAAARRFAAHQTVNDRISWLEAPLVTLPVSGLAAILTEHRIDLVVNTIGVLQDPAGTGDVHTGFVDRLLAAIGSPARSIPLIHLSVPGEAAADRTDFSRTKRAADALIAASGVPCVILRPGLVLAPAAYGGSAMLRALAALPIDLPQAERDRPFRTVAVEDIAETVALLTERWPGQSALWDVMSPDPLTLGDVVDAMRRWLGSRPSPAVTLPAILLDAGARLGDWAAYLGWVPPIRSTPLAELRRGVDGDPGPWMTATGIAPRRLADAVAAWPATVQERWFARLFLLKPLILGSLVVFWVLSGLIALASFGDAAGILTSHGFSPGFARFATVVSSLTDIAVGIGIAVRRTARVALLAGLAVSLFYMVGAAVLTPDLWVEPLGALVKTLPAMVLMLVALAILPGR